MYTSPVRASLPTARHAGLAARVDFATSVTDIGGRQAATPLIPVACNEEIESVSLGQLRYQAHHLAIRIKPNLPGQETFDTGDGDVRRLMAMKEGVAYLNLSEWRRGNPCIFFPDAPDGRILCRYRADELPLFQEAMRRLQRVGVFTTPGVELPKPSKHALAACCAMHAPREALTEEAVKRCLEGIEHDYPGLVKQDPTFCANALMQHFRARLASNARQLIRSQVEKLIRPGP